VPLKFYAKVWWIKEVRKMPSSTFLIKLSHNHNFFETSKVIYATNLFILETNIVSFFFISAPNTLCTKYIWWETFFAALSKRIRDMFPTTIIYCTVAYTLFIYYMKNSKLTLLLYFYYFASIYSLLTIRKFLRAFVIDAKIRSKLLLQSTYPASTH